MLRLVFIDLSLHILQGIINFVMQLLAHYGTKGSSQIFWILVLSQKSPRFPLLVFPSGMSLDFIFGVCFGSAFDRYNSDF